MNLRQGLLVTGFSATLFMNFVATYWTMWSVASISLFTLMVTDFIFFEVRLSCDLFAVAAPCAVRMLSFL